MRAGPQLGVAKAARAPPCTLPILGRRSILATTTIFHNFTTLSLYKESGAIAPLILIISNQLQFNNSVVLQQLFESLAFTDKLDFALRVHRFGSVATAVVVAAHGGTVSTGIMENQEVTHLSLRELARRQSRLLPA